MKGLLKLVAALGVEAALAAVVMVGIGLYKVFRPANKQPTETIGGPPADEGRKPPSTRRSS
jgi:hypothetical protein